MDYRYDVFLSYSHADAELPGGKELIAKIKREIEEDLADSSNHPLVFLDAEALNLGDEWHARIKEKLNGCRIFICLLSENYLKSSYCTRERIWWEQKEVSMGRLRKDTLPVYFVMLNSDPFSDRQPENVKELFGFQMAQSGGRLEPWIRGREAVKASYIRDRIDELKTFTRKRFLKKCLAEKSFCNIKPPLTPEFVGRLLELKELREECNSGRYPVIHAAGGVGKTELATAYAYGYAEDYPQGRFMIRMEGIRDWQTAILSFLKDPECCRVLGITEEELKEAKEDSARHGIIVDRLFQRAAAGNLLILLDNVDDSSLFTDRNLMKFSLGNPIPQTLHMVATTRHQLDFPKNSRAVSFPIGNLDPRAAFELFCQIGHDQFPFCKAVPDDNDPEYLAVLEIIRLLEGHAWSMEMLAGFMAENYANGMTFRQKLADMKKDCNVEGEFAFRHSANSAEALLNPTLDCLRKLELGEAIIELACIAALFPPEMIQKSILKNYWQEYFAALAYDKGEPFAYAMNQLHLFHLLHEDKGIDKMHRLTRSALRHSQTNQFPVMIQKFVTLLQKNLTFSIDTLCDIVIASPDVFEALDEKFREIAFSPESWKKICRNPELHRYFPEKIFNSHSWSSLLQVHPECAYMCPWEELTAWDLSLLIASRPQFANQCPWEKFKGFHWSELLQHQPQFSPKCPWEKLSGNNWSFLLRRQPQFADQCLWEKLSDEDWRILLNEQPQFADKYSWKKLNGNNWSWLLRCQPQFADKCPWEKLDGSNWQRLLQEQPQFADKCPWEKLDGYDWSGLLQKQPQFANKCPWEKLDSEAWSNLLQEQPQFANNCFWEKIDTIDLILLLKDQPQFANIFPWQDLEGNNWSSLLSEQPQFADKCPWEELDGYDWSGLLQYQPKFAKQCPWDLLNGSAWSELLQKQPQFTDKCPWEKLAGHNWSSLLQMQPQFADKCPWEKLAGYAWSDLLQMQPQFAVKCSWEKLSDCRGGFDNQLINWLNLLEKQPQLAVFCPWEKLEIQDWIQLFCYQPQFADKCPWDKFNSDNWVQMLREYPQFADKCPWGIFNGQDWVLLLEKQPQFADKCPWEKMDAANWEFLLSKQPQFADQCPWSKFNIGDWIFLLRNHPEFIDHCPLEKFSGIDWSFLLREFPQFADQCPWDKFNGTAWIILLKKYPEYEARCPWNRVDIRAGDWISLLQDQPQFADKCPWEKWGFVTWFVVEKELPQFADRKPSLWKRIRNTFRFKK